MRADQQISLMISGDQLLITCEDPDVINAIRRQASDYEVAPTSLLGFHIAVPTRNNRMWVLLGGNGVVAARARSAPPVLRSLGRQLSAMLSPEHDRSARLRLSSIVGDRGAVLADPFLLAAQPVTERRYQHQGLRVLDSPYVELLDSHELVSATPNQFTPDVADDGHIGSHRKLGRATRLLWRGADDAVAPTPGQAVHAIATTVIADTAEGKLAIAAQLACDLEIELVSPARRRSVLAAASEALN